jgi:hypothetical protein
MRAVICLLTAAITFGACGGETPRITGFKLGPDGRPDMSTAREVESVQQAVIEGLAYVRNCAGEQAGVIYGKELKICGDFGCNGLEATPQSCTAYGAGGYDLMFISFDSISWLPGAYSWVHGGSIGGQTVASKRPYSFIVKATDYPFPPTTHSNFEFYTNLQFGGCSQFADQYGETRTGCISGLGNGVRVWGAFSPFFSGGLPGSVEFNRWCGDSGVPGGGVSC